MNDEEKVKEVATKIGYGENDLTEVEALLEIARWKDNQYENKIRELLNNSFYLHPHNSNMICSDDFEGNDSFEDFVEEFIKRIKETEV